MLNIFFGGGRLSEMSLRFHHMDLRHGLVGVPACGFPARSTRKRF